jgi:hypothetical protein
MWVVCMRAQKGADQQDNYHDVLGANLTSQGIIWSSSSSGAMEWPTRQPELQVWTGWI